MLLALELMLRCALKPFKDQAQIPGWVKLSRQVYPQALNSLSSQAIFNQKRAKKGPLKQNKHYQEHIFLNFLVSWSNIQ
ncbi:MAG: hypothetical protein BGO39_06365 [Chloroflexi bacterium 54-19]|nr:MAG: hypothetical protein BGO39_06365 [Chloroflexi bacterium 54-19]